MSKEASRLRVAIVDPTHFGRAVLADLLADEGVREILKFSDGREFLSACQNEQFDLVIVDDALTDFAASELCALVKVEMATPPFFVALLSSLGAGDVRFLKQCGVSGVLLKPVRPKRFSALFRAVVKVSATLTLAA